VVQGGSNIPKQPDDVESVNGKPLPEVACDYGLISRSWFVLWCRNSTNVIAGKKRRE
jgi:hypothetical protein